MVNQDSAPHTVTATGAEEFDPGSIAGDGSAAFTAPSKGGRLSLHLPHPPYMKVTLAVR